MKAYKVSVHAIARWTPETPAPVAPVTSDTVVSIWIFDKCRNQLELTKVPLGRMCRCFKKKAPEGWDCSYQVGALATDFDPKTNDVEVRLPDGSYHWVSADDLNHWDGPEPEAPGFFFRRLVAEMSDKIAIDWEEEVIKEIINVTKIPKEFL